MVELLTETETWQLWAKDFDPDCESRWHDAAAAHNGPATHLQIALDGCEHATGFRCAGYVAWANTHHTVCESCGVAHPLKFIPIRAPYTE